MNTQMKQFAQGHTFLDDDKKITVPKHCKSCDYVAHTIDEVKKNFYRKPGNKDKRSGDCIPCDKIKNNARRRRNASKARNWSADTKGGEFYVLRLKTYLTGFEMLLDGETYYHSAGDHIWSKDKILYDDRKKTVFLTSFSGMKIQCA